MKTLLAALLLAASAHAAPAPYGILLLAHGGDKDWNASVEALRAEADAKVPTETSLGMADAASLQAAVDRLEKRGVSKIVAVPLFIQSRSEVLDQTRYVLGLREKPSEVLKAAFERMAKAHAGHAAHGAPSGHHHAFSLERVKAREPIAMTPALDDDALVGRILLERAKALSKNPARERIVLVAHGPVDDSALAAWNASLDSLCAQLAAGKFAGCASGVLRDDAPPLVRAASVLALRGKVAAAKLDKARALVLPVLIARGGIETKIPKDLAGLDYSWDGKTLMPHEGFAAWVLGRAANEAKKP